MIQKLFCWESTGFDPYRNLAVEEQLLHQAADCAILYLWQNENTVVIGRNQNPWKECNTALLAQEGGKLARRLSGGGAVFHDLGNLNFTILLPQEDFQISRQLDVIQRALERLGIPTERSGRNDLLAQGRKFSGNAFYKNGKTAYHHGTLLICADLEKLGRYLTPSRLKLQAKGVDSVRSRVENLCYFQPGITVGAVKQALKEAFSQVYGLPLSLLEAPDGKAVAALAARNQSWQWNYGRKLPFTCTLEGRFPWGGIEMALALDAGVIQSVQVFTDAMDASWLPALENALVGCPLESGCLAAALSPLAIGTDILSLFQG